MPLENYYGRGCFLCFANSTFWDSVEVFELHKNGVSVRMLTHF